MLVGDFIHAYGPDWKVGVHYIDPCLKNRQNDPIDEAFVYKSDLLMKGFNTITSITKAIFIPISTSNTRTKYIEHHWLLLRIQPPEGTRWIASWKDFFGNTITKEYSTLGSANRDASATKGHSDGQGIKIVSKTKGNGLLLGRVLEKVVSIPACYHLTRSNCQGYADELYQAIKHHTCPIPSKILAFWAQPVSLPIKPKIDFKTHESGPPYFRKVTVSVKVNDGPQWTKVGEYTARHFRHARKRAKQGQEDYLKSVRRAYEAQLIAYQEQQKQLSPLRSSNLVLLTENLENLIPLPRSRL